ncbi:MAG: hypothetical protein K6A30_04645 [Lachnospiraceae bacterium]|nr:hypothetical protein [Lachnospiraceae bacterium]
MNNTNSFEYNYSADKQREIEGILRKYVDDNGDVYEQIVTLDKKAERRGTVMSVTMGAIGTLIMGIGMSIIMVGQVAFFAIGVLVGVIGLGIISLAYPLYKKITQKDREKVAVEIINLSSQVQ